MSYLRSRIAIFRNQSFSFYVLSCLLAMFGNGLTYIAMTWVVVKLQGGVAGIAILMACFWLPSVVAGPLFGVYVDRWPRRQILIASNAVRVLCLLGFWLLSYQYLSVTLVYGLSLAIGTMLAFYIPAAMALVREIVSEDDLMIANSTVDIAYETGAVVGAGCAGLIIATTSIQFTFFLNAIFYLLANICLWMMRHQVQVATPSNKSVIEDMISGANYIWQRGPLLLIYSIQMCVFIAYMTAPILLAPYAKGILHTDVGQFGGIEAALSTGLVFGGMLTPYLSQRFGLMRILLGEMVIMGISFWAFSHLLTVTWSYAWYFVIGICFSSWPLLITEAQEHTDMAFQGRVQSFFNSFSGVGIMLIYGLMYVIGNHIGLRELYWSEIAVAVLAAGMLLVYIRKA